MQGFSRPVTRAEQVRAYLVAHRGTAHCVACIASGTGLSREAVRAASRLARSELDAMGNRGEAWFRSHFEREKLLTRLEGFLQEARK